ncbi:O-antigen ligase family protein [Rufibacter immobilis]|uniref:O-antigen ligase family protein n=1 Tax=Rufibacter immobilis TaxID=1348778 RepID=UPI001C83239E|nr:O-antigen ligase family protein [Rufibacter immobilis]
MTLQAMLPVLTVLFYRQLSRRQVHNTLFAFTFSCFLLSLHSLYVIGMEYSREEVGRLAPFPNIDWNYISHFMPHRADFHAPYYSFYIGVCLIIHSYFLFNTSFIRQRKDFFLHLFLFLYFFAFQALLASRTALVATVFFMALVALYLSVRAGKYVLVLAVILVTVSSSLLVYQNVSYLKKKISTGTGVSQREIMWRSAIDLIGEHPMLGTGTGDIEEALVTKYRQYHFQEGVDVRLDAHNQYLMHGASMGLMGAFMLLLLFLHLLLKAYHTKDYILFTVVAVFAICCITESMLQRRDGTLLFAFMAALLLFAPKEHISSATPAASKS